MLAQSESTGNRQFGSVKTGQYRNRLEEVDSQAAHLALYHVGTRTSKFKRQEINGMLTMNVF